MWKRKLDVGTRMQRTGGRDGRGNKRELAKESKLTSREEAGRVNKKSSAGVSETRQASRFVSRYGSGR